MTVLGKRAEKKSNFFVTAIFILAVIGAVMSSGDYSFGEEAITGHAVVTSSEPINYGFFGIILAVIALLALVTIGFVALSNRHETSFPQSKKQDVIPELKRVNKDIDDIARRLDALNR